LFVQDWCRGWSSLHFCAAAGDAVTAAALLECGARVDAATFRGWAGGLFLSQFERGRRLGCSSCSEAGGQPNEVEIDHTRLGT
jgi:hypothetical protein